MSHTRSRTELRVDHNTFSLQEIPHMSVVTPTLIPRELPFPLLLPEVPKPHPLPLQPNSGQPASRLNSRRSLPNEMDDLSDEETEVEDSVSFFTGEHCQMGYGNSNHLNWRGTVERRDC